MKSSTTIPLIGNDSTVVIDVYFVPQTQLVISASICANDFDYYGSGSSFVYVFGTGSKPGDS